VLPVCQACNTGVLNMAVPLAAPGAYTLSAPHHSPNQNGCVHWRSQFPWSQPAQAPQHKHFHKHPCVCRCAAEPLPSPCTPHITLPCTPGTFWSLFTPHFMYQIQLVKQNRAWSSLMASELGREVCLTAISTTPSAYTCLRGQRYQRAARPKHTYQVDAQGQESRRCWCPKTPCCQDEHRSTCTSS
jgi:hypothetical protein